MITILDFIIYWTAVLIPFSIAIAPAPASVFMGFLIAAFLCKRALSKNKEFVRTQVTLPLLLFFTLTCISMIHSLNFKDSLQGGVLRLLLYVCVYLALVQEVKDASHIKKIIFAIALGLSLVSVDAVWQVITGHSFIRRDFVPVMNIGLLRATASFKDSNLLGIYLSALVPLVAGFAFFYGKARGRVFFILVTILSVAGIALTYSRPTILALYISFLLFAVIRKNKILIAFLIGGLCVSPFIAPASVKEWAKQVDYNPVRFMCNDDRIAVYHNAIRMIRSHPLIGVGTNTFMKNYKAYKEFPEYRNVVTSDFMYAHNNFLHMAAEIGLLGLGVFVWLLYRLFKECLRLYGELQDKFLKTVCVSVCICLIAFLVNGLTESSLFYARVAVLFWYLAGLALSLKKFVI
jgi:putative inorganic carbon (HCO3(-)) transporter